MVNFDGNETLEKMRRLYADTSIWFPKSPLAFSQSIVHEIWRELSIIRNYTTITENNANDVCLLARNIKTIADEMHETGIEIFYYVKNETILEGKIITWFRTIEERYLFTWWSKRQGQVKRFGEQRQQSIQEILPTPPGGFQDGSDVSIG
jgi:hypothetical protein